MIGGVYCFGGGYVKWQRLGPYFRHKGEGGGPWGLPGGPNFDANLHGFWGSSAPGSRGNRFLASKSPIPTMETLIRSYLVEVFETNRKFSMFVFGFSSSSTSPSSRRGLGGLQ